MPLSPTTTRPLRAAAVAAACAVMFLGADHGAAAQVRTATSTPAQSRCVEFDDKAATMRALSRRTVLSQPSTITGPAQWLYFDFAGKEATLRALSQARMR
jgi:hypothetical protein